MEILLVCNAGMSTGIMKLKLENELIKRQIGGNVNAVALNEIDDYIDGVDVILLGPQIRFALDDVSKKSKGKLTMVIAPQIFGSMNAQKVMDDIIAQLD